ncbi:MAG: PAS domain S-box protein, partial [Gammaproteobacteria bacterium]|nr:PAS domain S-box protein [Gammaproteobacteria bacterium]
TRDDRIDGVVITYVEITALRLAAQEGRRLATVLRDANDAVIGYDFAGRIVFWNAGAQWAYGYTEQAALAMNIRDLEPAGASSTALALAERVTGGASERASSTQRLTADGRVLNVSVAVSALRDDAGSPYAVLSTERDITERLQRESELRFRSMADDIPTLLRIEDADGRAQFLNRAWLVYTGETAEEALLATGWLRYVHPNDLPAYVKGMSEARKNRTRFEGDLRLRRHDGVYRWMRTTAVSQRNADGHFAGHVSVSVDIEDRKRAEQAVAREDARKDEFLAMLAHELRNPLSPVVNAVAVIERCHSDDPKIAWASAVITRQTQQLTRLVDDLMDIARIKNGKIPLTREPIDAAVLVERAREMSQVLIDSRNQHLVLALPPKQAYVEGDLVRLTQVMSNLLNNASKYSDAGGEICLTVTSSSTEVAFSVTDHGAGISPEMLPHVFDLFAQEDNTLDRVQGGLGIGLSVVERLVRAHGGSVEARSPGRGGGSEFIVRLPALSQERRESAGPGAQAHGPSRTRRLLVVDDNVDSATTLAVLLEQVGHEARTAKDGTEALAIAATFEPDAVLLDIGLPGMSGYEVARHLRARAGTARALLIAVTGYGRPEDLERTWAAGFDHHLVKPVAVDKLLKLLSDKLS